MAVFWYLDIVLQYAALLTFLVAAIAWVIGAWRNPVAAAPQRESSLKEDAVILPVLVYCSMFVVLAALVGFAVDGDAPTPAGVLIGSVAQAAGGATCLVLAAKHFRGGLPSFWLGPLHRGRWGRCALVGLVVTVLATGVCPEVLKLTVFVFEYFDSAGELPVHSTLRLLREETQPLAVTITLWLGAVVIAPVAEELFFRGMIQTVVLNLTGRRVLAIGAASIAFALAHTQQYQAIPALLMLAGLLGFAYEWTGSIVVPVVIHALFNFKTLVWDALARSAA